MTKKINKDRLYAQALSTVEGFEFDENVARVFPDMINRSVPGYSTIVNMMSLLAQQYAQANSNCYDLGCSLGATSLAIENGVADKHCTVIAIDNSEAMLEKFRDNIKNDHPAIELRCQDIRSVDYTNTSFVALNFTLQFLPPDDRLPLIQKIYDSMLPGGCLILSEKIVFDSSEESIFQTEAHTHFKLANGYSELEISQKRAALENVLIGESTEQHLARLKQAGFSKSFVWFQCFNFVSIIALKD